MAVDIYAALEEQAKMHEGEARRIRAALAVYSGNKIQPEPINSRWGRRAGDKTADTAEALLTYLRSVGRPISLDDALRGLVDAGHRLAQDPRRLKNLAITQATNRDIFYRRGPGVSTDEIGLLEWGVTA